MKNTTTERCRIAVRIRQRDVIYGYFAFCKIDLITKSKHRLQIIELHPPFLHHQRTVQYRRIKRPFDQYRAVRLSADIRNQLLGKWLQCFKIHIIEYRFQIQRIGSQLGAIGTDERKNPSRVLVQFRIDLQLTIKLIPLTRA
jgi:hypothetical protein